MIGRLREWADSHTSEGRWTPVAITFHWTMAALVLFQLVWGWWTSGIPVGGDKVAAYQIHANTGLLILLLAVLRAIWRLMIPGPINDADDPGWESTVSRITHFLFYIFIVGLPLSGWLMLSATAPEMQLMLGGVIPAPRLPVGTLSQEGLWQVQWAAERIHFFMVWGITFLIMGHVAAVVKHYVFDKDNVLPGMLPLAHELEGEPIEIIPESDEEAMPRTPKPRRSAHRKGAG
ncbi:MAG: cytochrome b [Brevundimonas sp.]